MNPQEIERAEFQTSFRGYDKSEVRNFLRRTARELVAFQTEQRECTADVHVEGEDAPQSDEAIFPGESEYELDRSEAGVAEDDPASLVAVGVDPSVGADDRFQALGDRIAGLLKSAHESAAGLRESAEVEAAQKIELAQSEADEVRSTAQAEAEKILADAKATAEEIQASSEFEAEKSRATVVAETDQLRSDALELHAAAELANTEVAEAKEQARVDAVAELQAQRDDVASLAIAATEDRDLAMAELADARGQVAELLGQARSQSEFIRHEADEVIRARVRKNMTQAEERLNVLRNSEIASRERIAAAHRELEGAMARLDVEPTLALPADPEQYALDGAQQRADLSEYGALEVDFSTIQDPVETALPAGVESAVAEVPTGDGAPYTAIADAIEESEMIEVDILEPVDAGDVSDESDVDGGVLPIDVEEVEPVDSAAVGIEDEDALGRLVREAMKKAVDSARSSDS